MDGIGKQSDVERIEAEAAPSLPATTCEAIRVGAAIDPDAPALSFFATVDAHRTPRTWTYRELVAAITQTANLFHRLCATKDTVIAVALPNLPETHFAIWGAETAGIAFPLNPLLETAAFETLLDASGATILVTQAGGDLWRRVQPAIARSASLRHVVFVNFDAPSAAEVAEHVVVHDFTAIAEEDGAALASRRAFSPSDASSWFATGGTTGVPKLAMRVHGNEVANAWSVSRALGDAIGPRTVVLCGLPLFHVNAVMVTGLLPFSRGAHVVLATQDGYRTPGLLNRFWEIVEHHRVNFFSGVPTVYAKLLEVSVDAHDISSLRFGLCGAAPMPVEVFRSFEERTGVRILEGYGLTEATCVSSLNPVRGERRVGSIGLRLPGQLMKAVAVAESGAYLRDCAVGEVGDIVVSGANVFAGYREAAQNAGLFVDCGDGRRWLATGDLGRCDADGYFWLTGRKKEVIKRGGHGIDPGEIERPLQRHPAVQMAAAVGRPDAHSGEVPVAYVQPKQGVWITEATLLEHLRREIGEHAALPRRLHVIGAMPLTAVGKIFKPELRRREAEDALKTALRDAGIDFRALTVTQDPARGMVAEVALDRAASSDEARRVLGAFSLPFTLAT